MGLCAKVIDLVGLHFGNDPRQVRTVGQIAVVQFEARIVSVWIFVGLWPVIFLRLLLRHAPPLLRRGKQLKTTLFSQNASLLDAA